MTKGDSIKLGRYSQKSFFWVAKSWTLTDANPEHDRGAIINLVGDKFVVSCFWGVCDWPSAGGAFPTLEEAQAHGERFVMDDAYVESLRGKLNG